MTSTNQKDFLVVRVSVDVAETDYGSSLAHTSSKFRIDIDHPEIPATDVGESARTMLANSFDLPAVGRVYDVVMENVRKQMDEKSDG